MLKTRLLERARLLRPWHTCRRITKAPLDRVVEVAFGGVIATNSSDTVPDPVVPFTAMLMKDLTARFVLVYEVPQSARQDAARGINRLIAIGKLKDQIAKVSLLERVAEAHERMEADRVVGKLLICP